MHINFSINIENFNYQIELEEVENKNDYSIIIEGKNFIINVKGEGDNLPEIQQRIHHLILEKQTDIKHLYSVLLNIKDNDLQFNENYNSLTSINNIVQKKIFSKELKMPFKLPTLREKTMNEFDEMNKQHNVLLDKSRKIEDKIHQYSYYPNQYYPNQLNIIKNLKKTYLSHQKYSIENKIKQVQIQKLETLFKLHQQIPVKEEIDTKGETKRLGMMLELAIATEHIAYANRLIQGGTQIKPYHLLTAIVINSEKLINRLVEAGANVNLQNKEGYSLLQMACIRGKIADKAIDALIQNGADLSQIDGNGRSAIYEAITFDLPSDKVKILLKQIQNPSLENKDGSSLLDAAITRQLVTGDREIVKALLKMKANPNSKDKEGITPLHHALGGLKTGKKILSTIKDLLQAGANVNAPDNKGQTPLHHLISQRTYPKGAKVVELLVKAGANVNAQDNQGMTALHIIAEGYLSNNKNTMLTLIKNKADLNIQDQEGNTPLHKAIQMENVEAVEILLKAGANSMIKNNQGELPGKAHLFGRPMQEHKMRKILDLLSRTW